MARITVEDCLKIEPNRFALVILASKRTRQLVQGAKAAPSEGKSNKAVVTSLREIADGKVTLMSTEESIAFREQQARSFKETSQQRRSSEPPNSAGHAIANGNSSNGAPSADLLV